MIKDKSNLTIPVSKSFDREIFQNLFSVFFYEMIFFWL